MDNFYDDPDEVRELALNAKYHFPTKVDYPGIRTESLLNSKFDPIFYFKFLSLFNKKITILNDKFFKIETGFHKIPLYDSNLNSPFNTGYIHVDCKEKYKKYAGVIYLNSKATSSSGTSFFKLKSSSENKKIKLMEDNNLELFHSLFSDYNNYDDLFYEYTNLYNPFTKRKYLNYLLQNKQFSDSQFKKIFEVGNVYNRIVIYNSTYFHAPSHFYVNEFEDRLTQPFFISAL